MYGAAAGDVRVREGQGTEGAAYGAPTILAAACADALLSVTEDAEDAQITAAVAEKLREWARRHDEVDFGRDFWRWASGEKEHLSTRGGMNAIGWIGSAGWLSCTLERTQDMARAAARAVSDDPQVLRAAQCMADLVFLGRAGKGKAGMLEFSLRAFRYGLNAYVDALCDGRPIHVDALDMPCVALSLYSICKPGIGSDDLDPFIAAAVGTLTEVDGSYPMDEMLRAFSRIPEDCQKVLKAVCARRDAGANLSYEEHVDSGSEGQPHAEVGSGRDEPDAACEGIEQAISLMYQGGRAPLAMNFSKENADALEEALLSAMDRHATVLVAWDAVFTEPDKLTERVRQFFLNGLVQYYEGVRATASVEARTTAVRLGQKPAVAIFTDGGVPRSARTLRLPLRRALLAALGTPGADGVVFNPFRQSASLRREAVLALLARAGVDTEDEWLPREESEAHRGGLGDLDPQEYVSNEAIEDAAVIMPGPDDLRYGVLSQTMGTLGMSPVAKALMRRARDGGKLILGYKVSAIPSPALERLARRTLLEGDFGTVQVWTQVLPVAVSDDEGDPAIVAFTKPSEAQQWRNLYRFASMDVVQMLGIVERMDDNVGLCLNPFGVDARLKRSEVLKILEMIRTGQHM